MKDIVVYQVINTKTHELFYNGIDFDEAINVFHISNANQIVCQKLNSNISSIQYLYPAKYVYPK